jgi:tRNA-Thr(GGU) m(6)t(6)A37 methyltransferase TsaA
MATPPAGLTVIGVVSCARIERADTPVQAALNPEERATVVVHEPFVEGLDGLAGFDYAWLLTWLGDEDRPEDRRETGPVAALRQVPFLLAGREARELGIFATRGPRRVNPIGLSLVRLDAVDRREVRFRGVDLVDGTPVLDIKPYVTAFDRPPTDPRCGWFDEAELVPGVTPRSLRGRRDGAPGSRPPDGRSKPET